MKHYKQIVLINGHEFISLCETQIYSLHFRLNSTCKDSTLVNWLIEFFSEMHKNGNNANIGISGFTT